MDKSNYTAGAIRAATIIMNGKTEIKTEWGTKRLEGITDLIDRETGAGALLEACRNALIAMSLCPKMSANMRYVKGDLERAIAKATGEVEHETV